MSEPDLSFLQQHSHRIVVVAGPSGVGKSTVVGRCLQLRQNVWLSVSATTRDPRPGEVDGVEYLFVTGAEFDALLSTDGFLEWAEYSGNRYGTPVAPITAQITAGNLVLLEIDVQGVRQVKAKLPGVRTIFIAPPTRQVLVDRLTSRDTDSPAAVRARLAAADEELAAQSEFDYVLVNRDVDQTAGDLLALVPAV